MKNVIVRSGQSGVWFGQLVSSKGDRVTLDGARKIWRWRGANTTSDIAIGGIEKDYSRVTDAIDGVRVFGVCEVIPATDEAAARIVKCGWSE